MSGHCCRTPMNCNSFLTSIPASKLVSSQAVHFICTPLPHLSESLLLGLSWEFSGYGYFGASPGGASFKKNPPANAGDLRGTGWVGKIPWRMARQPTPVFLPGESHGQWSWRAAVHRMTKRQT